MTEKENRNIERQTEIPSYKALEIKYVGKVCEKHIICFLEGL